MSELLIRADASTNIGGGHLMRCLALAQGWKGEDGTATFLSHCESDGLLQRIESAGLNFVSIEKPYPDASDLQRTLVLLDQLTTSQAAGVWLVLDGYHFDSTYQQAIRSAGHRLLVIDDMAHLRRYHADLLLNQNIHAERLSYCCDSDTEFLLGTDYVMLRPEFQPWRGWKREIPETPSKVLISLGSSDPENVALRVIQALQQTGTNGFEVRIAVGPTNPNLETLQQAIARSTNMQLLVDVTYMPEQLAWADVAISAGGTTCWESAFMGLPSIVIVLAENQAGIAQSLDEAGAVVNLGWHEHVSGKGLSDGLEKLLHSVDLLHDMSRRGQEIVDGEGVGKVISEIKKRSIKLRAVSTDDCRLVWEWANEPDARASSFSSEVISWGQHAKWFETKVHDSQCLYYIALDFAGEPIGQVRYDLREDEAVISVSLDAKSRGNGYGSLIIKQASDQVFDVALVKTIHAYVKKGNEASVHAFAKAGYKEKSMTAVRGQEAHHFILTTDRLK